MKTQISRSKSMTEQEALIQNMLQVNEVDKVVERMWATHSLPFIADHISGLLRWRISECWLYSIHQRTSREKAGH